MDNTGNIGYTRHRKKTHIQKRQKHKNTQKKKTKKKTKKKKKKNERQFVVTLRELLFI